MSAVTFWLLALTEGGYAGYLPPPQRICESVLTLKMLSEMR